MSPAQPDRRLVILDVLIPHQSASGKPPVHTEIHIAARVEVLAEASDGIIVPKKRRDMLQCSRRQQIVGIDEIEEFPGSDLKSFFDGMRLPSVGFTHPMR